MEADDGVSVLRHETNRITDSAEGSYNPSSSVGPKRGGRIKSLSTSFSRHLMILEKNPNL